jgi:hypothetical protein
MRRDVNECLILNGYRVPLHNIQQPLRGNKLKGAAARLRGMVFGDQICVYQFKQPCKLRPNF